MRFRFSAIKQLLSLGILAGALAVSATVQAAFIVPNSTAAPFEDWSRNDASSLYAEWDTFTTPSGPNTPDVGSFPGAAPDAATSTVQEVDNGALDVGAFLTSGNIYSPGNEEDDPESWGSFEVLFPNYGNGSGWNTRVGVQVRTNGTEPDLDSFVLTYENGGTVSVPLLAHKELSRVALGGFGGFSVDNLFVFDADFNPSQFKLTFVALGAHMSVDSILVDTFTTQSELTPVPEPTTGLLLAIGMSVLGVRYARSRRARR
jgi:hypothetical protein